MNNGHAIIVNMRSQTAGLTGVQRYAQRLCASLGDGIETVRPSRPLQGFTGIYGNRRFYRSVRASACYGVPLTPGH